MRVTGVALLLAARLACGCSQKPAPAPTSSTLPAGTLARAGSELVSAQTATRVALAQGVTPRVAVERALSDALFAHAGRVELPRATARGLERVAAARALLEQLLRDAEKAGPPSAQEISQLAQERWTELNRPDAARTTHAVVLNDQPERDAAARAVAEKLHAALASVTSSDQLLEVAQGVPGEGFEIRAETLPFVTADGRVLQRRDAGFIAQPGGFDVDFARAANAIAEPGQLSGVVKSAFGYHIIRLDERALGSVVPEAELPSLLAPEVLQRRAKRARRELLERLKPGAAVQIERAAGDLTARVEVAP